MRWATGLRNAVTGGRDSGPWGYVLAVVVVALAAAVDSALRPLIHYVPLLAFYLAVVIASALGGRGPGILALAISATAGAFLMSPESLALECMGLTTLLVVGIAIMWFITSAQQAADILRRSATRREFLSRATSELARSLDVDATFRSLVGIAVPSLADLCAVDMVEEGGALRRVAVQHVDPAKLPLVTELHEQYPPTRGVPDVVRTGESRLSERIRWADVSKNATGERQRELLHALGFCSFIGAPIRRGDQTIGVISLAMSDSARHYTADDLVLANALADRAGVAIENARLYRELEQARAQAAAERDIAEDMQRRAELASRGKDEFLAMLGHELRNPLAPIVTTLELMSLRAPGQLERERKTIERQVRHLGRLVEDLLDVARITRGKIELQRSPTELADVVGKAVEMTGRSFADRGQALHVDIAPGLVVECDADRLAQVVTNLLNNATKYTERGGEIRVTGAREHHQAVLRVRDNGIGISPEMLPRVFDVFVQERQALDRAQGGLGLGLAIVKSLVELHGGTVAAASDGLGHGTELTVRLPLYEPHAAAEPCAAAPVAPRSVAAERAARVLVVDDNPDALASLAGVLEARGYLTFRASDGPSAIELAARVRPELALLDIGLPVMDGYELARRLHGVPGLERVKLVAVTGYGQPSDLARSRAAGFDEHLVKPVTLDAIEAAIARLAPAPANIAAS